MKKVKKYFYLNFLLLLNHSLPAMQIATTKLLCTQAQHNHTAMVEILRKAHAVQSKECSNTYIQEKYIGTVKKPHQFDRSQMECNNPYCSRSVFLQHDYDSYQDIYNGIRTFPGGCLGFLQTIQKDWRTLLKLNHAARALLQTPHRGGQTLLVYSEIIGLVRHKRLCFSNQARDIDANNDHTSDSAYKVANQIINQLRQYAGSLLYQEAEIISALQKQTHIILKPSRVMRLFELWEL